LALLAAFDFVSLAQVLGNKLFALSFGWALFPRFCTKLAFFQWGAATFLGNSPNHCGVNSWVEEVGVFSKPYYPGLRI